MQRWHGLPAFVTAAVIAGSGSTVHAQAFPARPVTMVVPFSAGGPTDTLGRILAERMRRALGQTVIVDNTSGAGGSLGVARVARAAPDGYTLSIGHWGTHVVNGAYYKLQYDLLTDLEPVAMIASNPQLVISKLALPATTLKELVTWIRSSGDKVLMATGGVGGASHIAAIYFEKMVGGRFQYVPYRGAAPAVQELLGGQVDLFVSQIGSVIGQIRSGRLRAYAVLARNRQDAAPEIPTVDEAGLPGLYTSVWHAVWVPKGTPRDVIAKLNAAIVESLADSAVRARYVDLGQELIPREQQTPEALGAHHKAEIEKWWPLIRGAGIRAE